MRKLSILTAAILAGIVTTRALAEDAKPPAAVSETPVYKATGEVKIDGVLDEPCWKSAVPIPVEWNYGKQGAKVAKPLGIIKLTWDDYYLYIGYETFDANLVAIEKNPEEFPDKGSPGSRRHRAEIWTPDPKVLVDVVEFFVSFNDPHFFWELHHNALNDFNDVWCTVPDPSWPLAKSSVANFGIRFCYDEYVHDDASKHTFAKAVHLKPKADGKPSTVNDPSDTDTGYTAEIRLPWFGLGAPLSAGPGPWKMAGQTIHVLGVVQNGDLDPKYYHTSPTRAAGGWFHTSYDSWPVYKMTTDPASADEIQK